MAKLNPRKIVKQRKTLAEQLESELENQGAVFFHPEEAGGNLNIDPDFLTLPKDLTEIPSKYLGSYLNAYTQQKAYMRTLYSRLEIMSEEAKRVYYDKYVSVYQGLTEENPKMSEKAKDLLCNNSNLVHDSFMEYRNCELRKSMVGSSIESYTECIFLISREISRRGSDFNENQRYDNLHQSKNIRINRGNAKIVSSLFRCYAPLLSYCNYCLHY